MKKLAFIGATLVALVVANFAWPMFHGQAFGQVINAGGVIGAACIQGGYCKMRCISYLDGTSQCSASALFPDGGTSVAGVTSVGTFANSSQPNGASINLTAHTITFGPEDFSNPGMVRQGQVVFFGDGGGIQETSEVVGNTFGPTTFFSPNGNYNALLAEGEFGVIDNIATGTVGPMRVVESLYNDIDSATGGHAIACSNYGYLKVGSTLIDSGGLCVGKENTNSNDALTFLSFNLNNQTSSSNVVEVGRFSSGGNLLIASTTDDSSGNKLQVTGNAGVSGTIKSSTQIVPVQHGTTLQAIESGKCSLSSGTCSPSFTTAFAAGPNCTCSEDGSVVTSGCAVGTPGTSSFTITTLATAANAYWICVGNK